MKDSTKFYVGRPCKYGHSGKRYAKTGSCVECNRLRNSEPERLAREMAKNRQRYREDAGRRERVVLNSRAYLSTVRGRAKLLLRGALVRSRKRGEECEITEEWIAEKLQFGKCEITGIPFTMECTGKKIKAPFAPSLDRIDNSRGYTKDNCRLILWGLNQTFNWWGEEVAEEICRAWFDARTMQQRKVA